MRARSVSTIQKRRTQTSQADSAAPAAPWKRNSAVNSTPRQCWQFISFLILFRLLNAITIQTFFNPDEYWQSVEVAHRMVFGYGYLTWEWDHGLRGYFHPLIFAALFQGLAVLGLDSPFLVRLAPRLLQGGLAAVGDLFLYLLSLQVFGCQRTAFWTLACNLTNWFTFFCIPRTFSSSTETVLTIMALYYWAPWARRAPRAPWTSKAPWAPWALWAPRAPWAPTGLSWKAKEGEGEVLGSRRVGLWIAAVACVVRPTSAILWLYVGGVDLMGSSQPWRIVVRDVIPIGAFTLSASSLLDRWMSGRWQIPALNFLRFNVLQGGSVTYGTHTWHWYFSHGFPAMLLTFLPLVGGGIGWSTERHVAGLVTWTLGVYSCMGHKEFRFVLPVLPLALMYAGHCLACLEKWDRKRKGEKEKEEEDMGEVASRHWSRSFWAMIVFLAVSQIGPALYFSTVHQRGSVSVMTCLEKEAREGNVSAIHFLMPCHSTPFYSHIHHNVSMEILECAPSFDLGHVSETDLFLADPLSFYNERYVRNSQHATQLPRMPSHIVMFDTEERKLIIALMEGGYTEICRYHHAHFPVDRELQGSVVVYRKA